MKRKEEIKLEFFKKFDNEKAFLGGCRSERRFSTRIDELDKYINSLNKKD